MTSKNTTSWKTQKDSLLSSLAHSILSFQDWSSQELCIVWEILLKLKWNGLLSDWIQTALANTNLWPPRCHCFKNTNAVKCLVGILFQLYEVGSMDLRRDYRKTPTAFGQLRCQQYIKPSGICKKIMLDFQLSNFTLVITFTSPKVILRDEWVSFSQVHTGVLLEKPPV